MSKQTTSPAPVRKPGKSDAIMTAPEAARLLGCSKSMIYDAAKRNEIPNIRMGRFIFIPKKAFFRMLDEGNAGPSIHGGEESQSA